MPGRGSRQTPEIPNTDDNANAPDSGDDTQLDNTTNPETDTTVPGNDGDFNVMWFYPGQDVASELFTGFRAFINDVSVLESLQPLFGMSLRDFQSAPNGDLVAFFPDRLGIYGKFPVVEVHDIEIVDLKLVISDNSLVTHYGVAGDSFAPEPKTDANVNWLITSGIITIEMEDIVRLLLGLTPGEQSSAETDGVDDTQSLGEWVLKRFGMRPRTEEVSFVRSRTWEFMLALHKFQEAWSQQWRCDVTFTFMPEIYPGMRIELADHGIGLYVESVSHTGSRTGGFNTVATVSTPMQKWIVNGETIWKMLEIEYNPSDEGGILSKFFMKEAPDLVSPADDTKTIVEDRTEEFVQIIDNLGNIYG